MSQGAKRSGGRSWWMAPVALMLFGALIQAAKGQATPTAIRTIGFSVFGAASEIDPDYAPHKNYGFIFGANATRHTRLIDVTIEPRFGDTTGPAVGQKYFMGLLKFGRTLGPGGRIHPYAGAGIGYGTFTFEASGFQDTSTVYAVNGGADVDVIGNLGVKVDWQYQFWDLGVETNGFTPNGFAGGLVYRFYALPFRRRH